MNKISVLFIICCVLVSTQLHTQGKDSLFLINEIFGEVQVQTDDDKKIVLKEDDVFDLEDNFLFSTEDDLIILAKLNEKGKCYFVYPLEDLISYFGPCRCRARIGLKPGKILTYFQFVKFLENGPYLVLGGKMEIAVDISDFPVDKHRFYFIRYDYTKDSEPINKKLAYRNGKIIIEIDDLHTVDGLAIDPDDVSNYTFFYYDGLKEKSTKIGDSDLQFTDEKKLKTGILKLIENADLPSEDLFKEIERYINTLYGNPDQQELKNWLQKELDLKF